ncbi:MAG TPA: sulfate adenylyltransferase [Candidatus Dormibacteraeota bacterium]
MTLESREARVAEAPQLVSPFGGSLVDLLMTADELADFDARADELMSLRISSTAAADVALLGSGAYSPLAGFQGRADYDSVVERAQLSGGTPWTLPITLPAGDGGRGLHEGAVVALRDDGNRLVGVLTVDEVYERDLEREASEVYRTNDQAHPGVAALFAQGPAAIAGPIRVAPQPPGEVPSTPAETRAAFQERGWSTVVGFQTRNPVHRAHEYLTKVALEQVDGLLLHPLSGVTKGDDVPFEVRMECYRVLLDDYYPPSRVVLGVFPGAMRYAGPREAIYHGLVRRNYGCSHFIIGRDAAGVGNYYGTYDAQTLFDELGGADRLGFEAYKFEHTFYCRACESMASTKTCPHGADDRVILSGTRVREMLTRGDAIPHEFTRPEVAEILRAAYALAASGVGS